MVTFRCSYGLNWAPTFPRSLLRSSEKHKQTGNAKLAGKLLTSSNAFNFPLAGVRYGLKKISLDFIKVYVYLENNSINVG